ncbi:hypothetical protein Tco_1311948 [Tanacetum coccineum]
MLQRFNKPTTKLFSVSKKPKAATADLHKDLLGTRNPGLGYMAKRAQPALYDADTLFHPTHHPVSIWDSEEVLVHQVVSMKKMNEKPGHVRPANGFYEKLNALMFVPQQELSREQAYWLPANERASQTSNPNRPVTPFTHKSRPPSQVLASLRNVNAVFPQFEGIIKERTTQKPDYVSEWCFDYAKQFVEQQLIFDDIWTRSNEQCVLINKNLTKEKKNLLIKKDCLIAENSLKDTITPPSGSANGLGELSAFTAENTKLKAQSNHNVNTTKTAWRLNKKVDGSVKPQWKPTGRHFALYDNCPLTRIMSKGRTVADSIAARLTRPTAYKFKTDCRKVILWNAEEKMLFPRDIRMNAHEPGLRTAPQVKLIS